MPRMFTDEFKQSAVQKALNRGPGLTVIDIAEQLDIGYSTLQKWIRKLANEQTDQLIRSEKRPNQWLASDRLKALKETANLNESEVGAYCRTHGIYSHHLTQWQSEFEQMKDVKDQRKADADEKRQLKQQIKQLEKEVRRKDKALAEAAALLVLQKKAEAIWGSAEDT